MVWNILLENAVSVNRVPAHCVRSPSIRSVLGGACRNGGALFSRCVRACGPSYPALTEKRAPCRSAPAMASMSERRACPVSSRPAPGPMMVTSRRVSVVNVSAFVAPPTLASGWVRGISAGATEAATPSGVRATFASNASTETMLDAITRLLDE